MNAGHSHAPTGDAKARSSPGHERRLKWALLLTGSFLVAEVVGGMLLNSLALLSDAAHMMTDVVALAIALAAIRIGRRPADSRRTFGYHRFEILAAAFNALLLFAVAIYILIEAWQRWRTPAEVQTTGMLVVAAIGLVINLVSLRLLAGGKGESLNIKGAWLEVWSDLLGSVGVIAGALVIAATGWQWVDPLIAVGIGLWVLPRTWILLRETVNILLEGVPDGIDLEAVRRSLLTLPGVAGVHDLHVWAMTSGRTSLSAHIVHDVSEPPSRLLLAGREALAHDHGIAHVTLQLETVACSNDADHAELDVHP